MRLFLVLYGLFAYMDIGRIRYTLALCGACIPSSPAMRDPDGGRACGLPSGDARSRAGRFGLLPHSVRAGRRGGAPRSTETAVGRRPPSRDAPRLRFVAATPHSRAPSGGRCDAEGTRRSARSRSARSRSGPRRETVRKTPHPIGVRRAGSRRGAICSCSVRFGA